MREVYWNSPKLSKRERLILDKIKKNLFIEVGTYQKKPLLKLPITKHFYDRSSVLKNRQEYIDAFREIRDLGLNPRIDCVQKNWDTLAALCAILSHTNKNALILDVGATFPSHILQWLSAYGYKNLAGINIDFKLQIKMSGILYKYGDLTHTKFKSSFFDAITCISTIEHGVNIKQYLSEMSRILKPGGFLITSADYWPAPINTRKIKAYGTTWKIFNRDDVSKIIETAKNFRLNLKDGIELDAKDKTCRWHGREYTFIYFVLFKDAIL